VVGEGVTATMGYYGGLMRAAHNTEKHYDPVVEQVGYWTDNGAYYYGDAYGQGSSFCSSLPVCTILVCVTVSTISVTVSTMYYY
jgi:hypothetical protein